MEKFGEDRDRFKDVRFDEKPVSVDFQRLEELTDSEKGQSHLQCLVKHWEYKRGSSIQVLEEDLDLLCQQRKEIEQRIVQERQQILMERQRVHDESCDTVKGQVPVLDERKTTLSRDQELQKDAEHDSISYWKERTMQLEETLYQEHKVYAECDIISFWKERVMQLEEKLQACLQRESSLVEKTEGGTRNPLSRSQMDGLSGLLKRADFFLHLILQGAPIVIAHQDADLRYRFIFNHYPTLADEDVIGKTDYEILSGQHVEKINSVKREVMATGIATKREFTLNTPMFGEKTFLIYIEPVFTSPSLYTLHIVWEKLVANTLPQDPAQCGSLRHWVCPFIEPVFSKARETIGVNHVAVDVTDQVKRRERMVEIRVREAVQKATESKLEDTKIQEP